MTKPLLALASVLMAAMVARAMAQTAPSGPVPASPPSSVTATGSTTPRATLKPAQRLLKVEELWDMDLVGPKGRTIGEIMDAVESTADLRQFVVIKYGSFLGIGGKEVAVPTANLAVDGGKVVLRNMDVAQLATLAEYNNDQHMYRELDETQRVSLAQQ
ncbi:PRC-barrel domain-containing protein [Microvirga roseola]|uniref:PRC-barrel domain-containing protein n=1 Tax=Microvirga roseola TaxID=2883126 RepID=UPI001E614BB9|nr:PRC-barrel domain-containing protein [Microvirga roseola]